MRRFNKPLAILLLALAGCSGGTGSAQPTGPTIRGPADSGTTTVASGTTVPKAAPRWEKVADLSGSGNSETASFNIASGAIQWRLRWKCENGSLSLTPEPPLKKGQPLVSSANCRGAGEEYAIETGERRLKVETLGPWSAVIDQQVDTPVDEAPLPEMASARVLAAGDFYGIERTGKGSARLYQLPGGRLALRLDDFEVSANTELFVWLSEATAPHTSADVVAVPHVNVGGLTSTLGPQNYVLPPEASVDKAHSVVIWCEPVRIAYTAAALSP